jgi:hypothetical protein
MRNRLCLGDNLVLLPSLANKQPTTHLSDRAGILGGMVSGTTQNSLKHRLRDWQ